MLFLVVFVLAVVYLSPIIARQFRQLTAQLDRFPDQIDTLQINLDDFLGFSLPLETLVRELETDLSQLLKPDRIFRILRGASTNIVWLVIIFITSYHLLRDWEKLREWLFKLAPKKLEPDLRRLHVEIKGLWRAYLRGQLLIMSILGILSGIGAAAIGLPGALLLGFLAGILALIPNLGPTTAAAIAAVVAWTQGSSYLAFSNLTVAVMVVVIFGLIQLVEGFWLTPRIMGRRMNLHPGLVLVAVVGTLFTLGAVMALIISPLLASFDLVFRYIRRKRAGLDPWQPLELEDADGREVSNGDLVSSDD
jgi:predicted PurR-regulated permease PerM